MEKLLIEILSNYILNVGVISWIAAQVMKVPIDYLIHKKIDVTRVIGAGGMPSSHSALVCSMMVAVGKTEGVASPLFAVAFLFAGVVMYDAMGVRRAAGEHAKMINRLVFTFEDNLFGTKKKTSDSSGIIEKARRKGFMRRKKKNIDSYQQLKELIGHTPLEVLAGAALGSIIAAVF